MTPWFRMPAEREGLRQAALDDLRHSLAAIRCAIKLAEQGYGIGEREQLLLRVATRQLVSAESAVDRVAR